jgi:hypothetical protein
MTQPTAPAGWYPDIQQPGGERYWDSQQWTEQRRPAQGAPAPPVADQPAAPTCATCGAENPPERKYCQQCHKQLDQQTDPPSRKSVKVTFQKAVYLGGLPGDRGGYKGNLIVTDECIGMGVVSPKKSPVRWDDMAGISFDSATMKKSRAGKAIAFGVFALAAKNTQNAAEITVQRKDGNVALYTVAGKTGAQVRAKIQPLLVEHGVPCLDDAPLVAAAPPVPAVSPGPTSTADEIAKLVALRDQGAITEEEFTAYKANLMR